MQLSFLYSNHRHGGETKITVPAKYEVCHECDGTGRVLCDGLRGVAFSSDEMHEDPDFAEGYFRGDYDVHCDVCKGKRVELAPDEEKLTKRQKLLWALHQDEQNRIASERAYYKQCRERGIEY